MSVRFSIVQNMVTNKKQSIKISVAVYDGMDTSVLSAQGYEVVTLVNMSQQNGEIKTQDGENASVMRYCFYA